MQLRAPIGWAGETDVPASSAQPLRWKSGGWMAHQVIKCVRARLSALT